MDFVMPEKSIAETSQNMLSRSMLIFARIGDAHGKRHSIAKRGTIMIAQRKKRHISSSILK
jgi:hypothetical protein